MSRRRAEAEELRDASRGLLPKGDQVGTSSRGTDIGLRPHARRPDGGRGVLGQHLAGLWLMAQKRPSGTSLGAPRTDSSAAHTRSTSPLGTEGTRGVLLSIRSTPQRKTARGNDRSAPWVGANLHRLREERGVSLAQLAQRCGLDEPMLGAVEAGSLDPSIKVLWGIATALGVSFGTLVQAPPVDACASARERNEGDAHASTREQETDAAAAHSPASARPSSLKRRSVLPFAPHANRRTEVHELKLAARSAEPATQYANGTFESLLVTQGRVIVQTGVERHLLETGDSLVLRGDAERQYLNPGEIDAVMYAVVSPDKLA